MKTGKYSIKELFVNRYLEQIIIPEIQRDYVWGDKQVLGLLDSIFSDYKNYHNVQVPNISTRDEELKQAFDLFYRQRKNSANIGFIYAYNDAQCPGKYFLIDGQQRITTIFLILLALAYQDIDLREKFKKTFFSEHQLKLDYKVREAAHQFLRFFVEQVLSGDLEIKDKSLYFANMYELDLTVKNLLSNFFKIKSYLEKQLKGESTKFYSYLENFVEFWYFDTNISEQGEELYIYMNARGEQMQTNENLKAELLSTLSTDAEKNSYGKIWEDWQDFFWKFRGQNNNADIGFNTFLDWCKILTVIEDDLIKHKNSSSEQVEVYADLIRGKENLDFNHSPMKLADIELYFKSVQFYFENFQNKTRENSLYQKLVTNKWLKGNLAQIDQFRLLPFIYFIKKHQLFSKEAYDLTPLIRLNRLFYNLRLDETIGKTAATQAIYGIQLIDKLNLNFEFEELVTFENDFRSILNSEEIQKIKEIISIQDNELKEKTRMIFGKAEDHQLLRGKIVFLIDLSKQLSEDTFDYSIFESLWRKYEEVLSDEGRLKSECINSDSFVWSGDRIKLNDNWFKKDVVLNDLKNFYAYQGNYESFLDMKHNEFRSQYKNIEELKSEKDPKQQLYLFYLLSRELNIDWDWGKGKNFGIYYETGHCKSFFNHKLLFQHYQSQWHDNEWRIIDVQKQDLNEKVITNFLK